MLILGGLGACPPLKISYQEGEFGDILATNIMRACMNFFTKAKLAVLSVNAYCWETVAISEYMVGNESYRYRYSVWIEALVLLSYARPIVRNILCGLMSVYKHKQ